MRKLLLENLGMKITAVVLAVILWFFVTSKGQSEISMDVPLELKNTPYGLESVRQSVKSISVNIKGQERLLKNIKPSSVRAYLDLSKAKKGKGTYFINKDDIKLPHSMAVTNISPSSVWVVLEETMIKTVPVRAVIAGSPEKGFYVSSVEANPGEATIEGARSEVSRVKSLNTEQINISGLKETYVQDVRLDAGGRNIRTKIPEVSIKVVIKETK